MKIHCVAEYVVAGIYDEAQDRPIYLAVYPNSSVARREVFRLAHKAEYMESTIGEDFSYCEMSPIDMKAFEIVPMREVASAFGVHYKSADVEVEKTNE